MTVNEEFKWDNEKKELTQITSGDSLIDGNQNPVEGRFKKEFVYPHNTALNLIRELERQINEQNVHLKAEKEKLAEVTEVTRRIDKAFIEKFEACQKINAKKSHEANIIQIESQLKQVSDQLAKIKKEMGRE